MTGDTSDSLLPFASAGGLALVRDVACCIGLKIVGGTVLFGGLATTFGITTDQTTFVVEGLAGLLLAVLVLGYQRVEEPGAPS